MRASGAFSILRRTRTLDRIHTPAHIRIRRSKGKDTLLERPAGETPTRDCTRQRTSANRRASGNIRRSSSGGRSIHPGNNPLDIRRAIRPHAIRPHAIRQRIRWSPRQRPLGPPKIQSS
jgi:hypothetical protein